MDTLASAISTSWPPRTRPADVDLTSLGDERQEMERVANRLRGQFLRRLASFDAREGAAGAASMRPGWWTPCTWTGTLPAIWSSRLVGGATFRRRREGDGSGAGQPSREGLAAPVRRRAATDDAWNASGSATCTCHR